MKRRQPSLKRPLIVQPLLIQLFTLVVSFIVLLSLLLRIDAGGQFTAETFAKVAAQAVERRPDGSLTVRMTPALKAAREKTPTTWFVAQDEAGRHVSFGDVPPAYASLVGRLDDIVFGDMRSRTPPYQLSVVVRRERGPAGALTILCHGELTALSFAIVMAANVIVIPIFLLLALTTVILTPLIVRRALAGVARIANEAERIDTDRRGIRLTEAEVPREIGPLVRAVNDALSRLDEGYERQRRFIASAAHELRTPIAILRVKIDAAGDDTSRRLAVDIARLSNLAEQLLDLHRLDHDASRGPIDLPALVRRVAAELAPLLIASEKLIEVRVDSARPVIGDASAIERVVTNLVQNAVEHGGTRVLIHVDGTAIEVEDDGPGIPAAERERVFEPFYRIRPRSTGTGLGLNLVQQVIERHGGRVTILDAPAGGTLVRVELLGA